MARSRSSATSPAYGILAYICLCLAFSASPCGGKRLRSTPLRGLRSSIWDLRNLPLALPVREQEYSPRRIPAIFSFGDANIDVGNNDFLNSSLLHNNYPPLGRRYACGVPRQGTGAHAVYPQRAAGMCAMLQVKGQVALQCTRKILQWQEMNLELMHREPYHGFENGDNQSNGLASTSPVSAPGQILWTTLGASHGWTAGD